MIFRGTIIWVGPKETFTKSDGALITKINFVVEEKSDREYNDSFLLDMIGDKAESFINGYKEGDVVSVSFGSRVRDYTKDWVTRKFCSLSAYKLELEEWAKKATTGWKLMDPVEDPNDVMPF